MVFELLSFKAELVKRAILSEYLIASRMLCEIEGNHIIWFYLRPHYVT